MKNPPESQSLFTVGLIFSAIADKYNAGIRFFNRSGFNLAALIYNTDGGIFFVKQKIIDSNDVFMYTQKLLSHKNKHKDDGNYYE